MRSRATEARLAASLVLLTLGAGAAPAEPLPPLSAPPCAARVRPGEPWVLELRLGGRTLHGGLLALEHEGELLLPIAELAAAFELMVDVDPRTARADGWLIHPRRHFALDLGTCELRLEGAERELSGARVAVGDADLYADARSLSRWWPVDLVVDPRRLRIEAVARETLPVERRLERERLHARLARRRPDDSGPAATGAPYRWWGPPAADLHLDTRTLRPPQGGREWQLDYDLAGAGDLLKLRSELLWTGMSTEFTRLRLRAGRRDLEGRMGGPLRLREFTLGDVSTPSLAFVSQTRGGRGVQISSFPLDHFTELGQLSLEGDLRPGWEVELYRNEVLLDFQGPSDGLRYRFEDVPTVPGLNVFRLVFHGPRGEVREEERRIWMDGGLAPAGETRFRVTFNQHDKDLFAWGRLGGRGELRGEPRATGELEHGFGEFFTVALGVASLPLEEGQHHYTSLAARMQLAGSLLRADLLGALGEHEGYGAGAGWQTRVGRAALSLSYHEFRSFLSERTRQYGGERLEARAEANLDGALSLERFPLHYRIGVGNSRQRGGRFDTDADLRLATWLRPVWLTHTIRSRLDRGGGADTGYADGELLASYRHRAYGLRGLFHYGLHPARANSLSAVGEWTPRHPTSTRLGVTHTFAGRTSLVASLSRRVGVLLLSTHLEVDDKGLAQAGVGVSVGLTPDPHAASYRWREATATRSGSVAARIFLDQDADGRYGPGDRPLPGIGLVTRGDDARSGPDGSVLIHDLPVDERLDVSLDPGTIEDPHWLAPREAERVVLRPGAPLELEFPLVPVGEIDGTVRLERGGESEPLPGISVQLLAEDGEVAHSTRSQIDGFFLLQEIVPGRYRLRVDPEQALRLGLRAPPERELELSRGGAILGDQDLELRAP